MCIRDSVLFINLLASKFINKTKTDIFYFADSLGSLSPKDTKIITKTIKKHCKKQLGIHAHDNLGNALNNSLSAIKNGAPFLIALKELFKAFPRLS